MIVTIPQLQAQLANTTGPAERAAIQRVIDELVAINTADNHRIYKAEASR